LQTTYSHIPDKQLEEANKRRCSSGTKHERQPLRMVKQWWPKHVGFQ
jgi:hypothetical protein